MILIDTFNDFIVHGSQYRPAGHRAGQAQFNLLVKVRPDLAEMVRGSDFDPFHRDERLPEFYGFLARHWNDGL